MKTALVIFPHQLFDDHPGLRKDREIFLVEDQLFLDDFKYHINFHRHKLILHRATMMRFMRKLVSQGYNVNYIEFKKSENMDYLFSPMKERGIDQIIFCELMDYELEKRVRKESEQCGMKIDVLPSPAFLNSPEMNYEFFNSQYKFNFTQFYISQRRHYNILIDKGKPLGGKWTYDTENRKRLPVNHKIPVPEFPQDNIYVEEAVEYCDSKFPESLKGNLPFFYPVTCQDIDKWLSRFFKKRFVHFGAYQDSIDREHSFLYHSIISYALNIGLVTPKAIIEMSIDAAKEYNIPLNSLEGFLRQILGWREFIRAVYTLKGSFQRTQNFWGFSKEMPKQFYDGSTGIDPLDAMIKRVNHTAYLNHIERLMVIGNFMLLCEIDPDEVYKWFMSKFIDSFDWVMTPNVYGMSQFSDGGLISTKPYISSSNYILKMSNFDKGDWTQIWDALYWRFIYKYRKYFLSNPRLSMMVNFLNKKEESKINLYIQTAERFLEKIGLNRVKTYPGRG